MNKSELSQTAWHAFRNKKYDVALEAFTELQRREPNNLQNANNVGVTMVKMGEFVGAEKIFQMIHELVPSSAEVLRNLAHCLAHQCKIGESLAVSQKALLRDTTDRMTFSNLIYYQQYIDGITAEVLHDSTKQFAALHSYATSRERKGLWQQRQPKPGEPIEMAIISPDLHQHSVAYFLLPFLANYDHSRYRITLCIDGPDPDDWMTELLCGSADASVDIRKMSDSKVMKEMDRRKIIVAMDLAGHSAHNRLPIFSRRIAPIQVAWLGFIGTTGLSEIDARLVDPWTVIPEEYSTERQIILPTTHSYKPPTETPAPQDRAPGPIRFINNGNLAKISRSSIRSWKRIMDAVPDSTFHMKAKGFPRRGMLECWLRVFAEEGIHPARVKLEPPIMNHTDYMKSLQEYDIWLDTQPYASATTCCEALWNGVPVITRSGPCATSCIGVSIVKTAGFNDMAYITEEGYELEAIAWAKSPERLNEYRRTCRARLAPSLLFDGKAFAASAMDALDELRERLCPRS